ncbi:hypothetical protein B0H34DRAFT_662192, partial [Crassisporium funariophilum]
RKYKKALDHLQKLVVQQLFELQRMHLSQSGECIALQRCSKAIQRAVKTYNVAALALNPPRPTIDWSTVSHYAFLEDFPLLRDTSHNLARKCGAEPAVRLIMKQWHRI